jgi:hypothetical protein
MRFHTTPLEREILTHYWCYADPHPHEFKRDTLQHTIIERYIRLGLLKREGGVVHPNRPALEPYMEALSAVPLPTQKWIVTCVS